MTISVKHSKVSAKVDGGDSTLLRPSDWNAEHVINLATDKLLGRQTAGTGAVEEIACTAAGRSVIGAADVAAILTVLGVSPATTGDVKLTLKTTADSGWLIFDDGTFGNAGAGASQRNNADCQSLFTLLFNNLSDANAPILTSGGAATTRAAQTNAATAWAANCRMSLPKTLGRALAIAGSGAGLTSRALGATVGAETVMMARSDLPRTNVPVTITDPGHIHSYSTYANSNILAGGGFPIPNVVTSANTASATTGISAAFNLNGDVVQTAMPIVQPTSFLNAMVKL